MINLNTNCQYFDEQINMHSLFMFTLYGVNLNCTNRIPLVGIAYVLSLTRQNF